MNSSQRHLSDWANAGQAVQHWLALKQQGSASPSQLNKARDCAAKEVYAAMLSDAIGMVVIKVDKKLALPRWAGQTTPHDMAEEIMSSIFRGNRFTSIINSHDQAGDASLRTWLTKRIHWKLFTHLRREQRQHLHELRLPFSDAELTTLEQADQQGEMSMSAEDVAAENQMLASGLELFQKVLTERQQQVMLCYLDGANNDDGSKEVGVSLATYKREKKEALDKLKLAGELAMRGVAVGPQ